MSNSNKHKRYIHSNYMKRGQNFLICEKIIQKISESILQHVKNKNILIIGVGFGALLNLIPKNLNRTIVEIEKDLIEINISNQNITKNDTVINGDILQEIETMKVDPNTTIISNLPYYLIKPLMFKIINCHYNHITQMILMMPQSLDENIIISNTSFGAFVSTFFTCQRLIHVNRKCYFPIPKLDSSVSIYSSKINSIKDSINNFNYNNYYEFLKTLFKDKKKKINNNKSTTIKNIFNEHRDKRPHEINIDTIFNIYKHQ